MGSSSVRERPDHWIFPSSCMEMRPKATRATKASPKVMHRLRITLASTIEKRKETNAYT